MLLGALLFCGPAVVATAEAQAGEYEIKAAMIYRLLKFVYWPDETVAAPPRRSLRLCILGQDPFGDAMDRVEGREVRRMSVKVERYDHGELVSDDCQVLYISHSLDENLGEVLASFREQPILTVGDSSRFARRGGIVELTTIERRIGFTINQAAAVERGLQIAAPLLSLAIIVQ